MKKSILKILVCLILSSLLLSSCGANEDKVGFKETVSAERVMQQVEAKETVSEEQVMQQAEAKEIVLKELSENNLAESSAVSIDNMEDVELTFYPPKDSLILYGDLLIPSDYVDVLAGPGFGIVGNEIEKYFNVPEYNGAYYYVCLNTLISYSPMVNEIEYFKSFGITCKTVYGAHFAYVTEEQIKALSSDSGIRPYTRLYWVREDAIEEYITMVEMFKFK